MIDDLRENGGNQIEYMKQILLNRKYVYVKAMPQKSEDGLESHATWKIETDHWETHCACTNMGPPPTPRRACLHLVAAVRRPPAVPPP